MTESGSFAIWGPSRSDLDRIAWAVADAIDPRFLWVEVTERGEVPGSRELEVLEEIDLGRVERIDRADLASSESRSGGRELPRELAKRIDQRAAIGPVAALVIANLDRALALSTSQGAYLPSLIRGLRHREMRLVATFGGSTSPDLAPFDCDVRVRAGPDENVWNPTVDWSVRTPAEVGPIVPPAAHASTHEVVRHLRRQRA